MELLDTHNAAYLFFEQAARDDLKDRPRFMILQPDGGWKPVTWAECASRAEQLASFLIDRGVNSGSHVAVLASTRLEWGLAALGLLAARGSLVPAYPTLMPDQLQHILGHSAAEVLVVETAEQLQRVFKVWSRISVRTLITIDEGIDVQALANAADLNPRAISALTFSLKHASELGAAGLHTDGDRVKQRMQEIELGDVAYLVYTSGTTGMPKGVPLTHYNVGASGMDWLSCNAEMVREGDVDILWLPMSHLYGLGEFCLGNQVGFQTYFSNPLQALVQMPLVRPHVFMSVPAYWEKLMQLAQAASPSTGEELAKLKELTGGRLRFCLSGGAGLARSVKEFFLEAGILIIEGYGLTECSPNLTFNHKDDFDFDTVGKPCPSVQLKLAADGEILAKGPNVFSGYYKDPAATREIFDEEGWLQTGDLGRFTERGFLQIIGRKKEILVTSGGKNIPPVNIEMRFKDFPLVSQIMVYGDGKKFLTALVDINEMVARQMLDAHGEHLPSPLRQHPKVLQWIAERIAVVNQGLAKYETIKKFIISPELLTVEDNMLTPTLKLKRKNICMRYQEQLEALYQQE